jgi:hypothetical protein
MKIEKINLNNNLRYNIIKMNQLNLYYTKTI